LRSSLLSKCHEGRLTPAIRCTRSRQRKWGSRALRFATHDRPRAETRSTPAAPTVRAPAPQPQYRELPRAPRNRATSGAAETETTVRSSRARAQWTATIRQRASRRASPAHPAADPKYRAGQPFRAQGARRPRLAGQTPPETLASALHIDQRLLAQPDRRLVRPAHQPASSPWQLHQRRPPRRRDHSCGPPSGTATPPRFAGPPTRPTSSPASNEREAPSRIHITIRCQTTRLRPKRCVARCAADAGRCSVTGAMLPSARRCTGRRRVLRP
jgi:hypothetical protein